ncbi:MAG TPA: hypothetical protein VHA37_06255, partial [Candidatus Saccharimonadales bacterium]|nr:hypothetical protein [Candidatus Saccharimonadales bacterium]
ALLVGNRVDHQQKLFAHCNNSMGAGRRPIGNLAFAFILERRDQETTVLGRTLHIFASVREREDREAAIHGSTFQYPFVHAVAGCCDHP